MSANPNLIRHRKRWSIEDIATLVTLRTQLCPIEEIATELGRSPTAIKVALAKLPAPQRVSLPAGWMSSDQICTYLNVRRDWLYDLVSRNEIPHVKLGRLLRFKRSEIDVWMEGYRRDAL